MTDYFVGLGGNDGNAGTSWALRKLTLNGAEDIPVAAGDTVYVGPGTYRELLTVDRDGGSIYTAGTVTVTNGSTTITGAGTAFLANVAAADIFHVSRYAAAADGVANGTATFTSATGNFQANMVGYIIIILGRGPYKIGAVAAPNSITLTDPHGLGWPAAGAGLTYYVLSSEGPYEIISVTDNNNLELDRPWCGPTLTGLIYITYTPIRYIADVTGENTDGVGGIVRITGSNNDQAAVRAVCIAGSGDDYRIFRGFVLDTTTSPLMPISSSIYWIVEDCVFTASGTNAIDISGSRSAYVTIRRCMFLLNPADYVGVNISHGVPLSDTAHLIENCLFVTGEGVRGWYVGGFTVKNCAFLSGYSGIQVGGLATGDTVLVYNSIIQSFIFGLLASSVPQITENYNTLRANQTDRSNVTVGANSATYPMLPQPPILLDGFKFPWWFGELSEWSQVRAIAGFVTTCHDLRGFVGPTTAAKRSWGALQFSDMERDTGTVYAGTASMEISDAGRVQFKVPATANRYTIRVRVYREPNYTGTNPQLIIKQPGQADRITTDTGAAGAWNLLEDSFVPAASPPYLFIELVSNNTAVAGNYAVYFDDLKVRGNALDSGDMEHWLWDRQPMENYGKVTPVVRKLIDDEDGGIVTEINRKGDLLRIA